MSLVLSTARNKAERRKYWRLLRIAVLTIAAWSLLAWVAAHALIVRAELPRADAIVVLSGSGVYVERTARAAELWNEGRASMIFLTRDQERGGWSEEEQRNPTFNERAIVELRRGGVAADKIEVLPEMVGNTYDEAMMLRRYATAHGLRSLLVVTSAYHSRRALWTLQHVFEGSGIEVGLEWAAPGQQSPGAATWWWHQLGWKTVALEYFKFGYYWLHYR